MGPRVPQGPQARRRHGDQPRAPRGRVHPAGHRGADDAQGRRGAPGRHRPRPGPAGHRRVAGGHQARPAADASSSSAAGCSSSSSETDYARRYRASQDLPDVLARWGATLPPSRVHVVCCPPPDADPALLWQRFAGVVGFDPDAFPPAGPDSANPSLGTTEIDLLRRVNVALDKRLVQPDYGQVVKQLYAQELLEPGRSPRPVVPHAMYDDLRGRRRAVGQGDRHGGVRRARRPGLAGPRRARGGPGRTPTTYRPGTRSTPPSPRPPSCCSRCSGAAARWPGSRPTTPGSARSASGSSGGSATPRPTERETRHPPVTHAH